MPKCINDPKRSYTGKEPSPKGFGLCAHAEKEGTRKKGTDNEIWVVKKTKNESLRWVKFNDKSKYKSYIRPTIKNKYFNKSVKKNNYSKLTRELNKSQKKNFNNLINIKKDIEKLGINVFIIRLPPYNRRWFIDYAWDIVIEKYKKKGIKWLDQRFIIIVLKLNREGTLNLDNGEINIQHNNLKYNYKKDFDKLMKDKLKSKYSWDGKSKHTIKIKL